MEKSAINKLENNKNFYHGPGFIESGGIGLTVPDCENILAEWFGKPVILFSSARSGIDAFLRVKGFSRYENKLQIPSYLSRCVVNSLTPTVFPIEFSVRDKKTNFLLYHQYGFPQHFHPKDCLIEDIAHTFFASSQSGIRQWSGEIAAFSLPKFFSTAGCVGGLIVKNKKLLAKLKNFIAESPELDEKSKDYMRHIIKGSFSGDPRQQLFLESAYELLLKFYKPDKTNLIGFPTSLKEIKKIGEERVERINLFFSYFSQKVYSSDFWGLKDKIIPFALPYFGNGDIDQLEMIDQNLKEIGVKAGIYNLDVARDMRRPRYKKCLLLPCHQNIPLNIFEQICQIIKTAVNNN